MKKLVALSLLAFAGTAFAQWHPHSYGYRGYGYNGWVAPAIVGGVIGYELARPNTVVIQQPPVYIQQQPVYPQPPYGYHWQEMVDPQTGVHKIVAVPN